MFSPDYARWMLRRQNSSSGQRMQQWEFHIGPLPNAPQTPASARFEYRKLGLYPPKWDEWLADQQLESRMTEVKQT